VPIYEYECGKCGVFEQSQRMSDPALTKCPTCRRKVRRLISNTSFQLKGTGWYVTDYARNGDKKGKDGGKDGEAAKSDAKSDTASSTTSTDSTSSKSDTKAATGTPAKTAS
jgi:putative FmdB family regulatory protein